MTKKEKRKVINLDELSKHKPQKQKKENLTMKTGLKSNVKGKRAKVKVSEKKEIAPPGPPQTHDLSIVTTSTRPPKEKSKILTTRDLPIELPNYHGIRKGGKK